jgi:hypothetical protein
VDIAPGWGWTTYILCCGFFVHYGCYIVYVINASCNEEFLDEYDSLVPNDVNKMLDLISVDMLGA